MYVSHVTADSCRWNVVECYGALTKTKGHALLNVGVTTVAGVPIGAVLFTFLRGCRSKHGVTYRAFPTCGRSLGLTSHFRVPVNIVISSRTRYVRNLFHGECLVAHLRPRVKDDIPPPCPKSS